MGMKSDEVEELIRKWLWWKEDESEDNLQVWTGKAWTNECEVNRYCRCDKTYTPDHFAAHDVCFGTNTYPVTNHRSRTTGNVVMKTTDSHILRSKWWHELLVQYFCRYNLHTGGHSCNCSRCSLFRIDLVIDVATSWGPIHDIVLPWTLQFMVLRYWFWEM